MDAAIDSPHTPITADQFNTVCTRISESAKSLKNICTDLGISNESVYEYMRIIGTEAKGQYARAKEDQCDYIADEMMDIADEGNDSNKSRVQVDTRKWILSKLKAKRYGDYQQIEIVGAMQRYMDAVTQIIVAYVPEDKRSEALSKLQSAVDFG